MPLTALDPVTALIVVDLQQGVVAAVAADAFGPVVARSRVLAAAFRARDLPVVLVTCDAGPPGRTETPARMTGVLPPEFADLLPELDQQPSDIQINKRSWGAFTGTGLEAQLRALGVTQVVVAGVATGTGVEATARQAYEAGFNVTLATDAMTDPRPHAHDHSIDRVFPRLGECGSTDDILARLDQRG